MAASTPPKQDAPTANPLVLRPAPQISSAVTTRIIMRDVFVALIPAAIMAVVVFGLPALLHADIIVGNLLEQLLLVEVRILLL